MKSGTADETREPLIEDGDLVELPDGKTYVCKCSYDQGSIRMWRLEVLQEKEERNETET